MNNQLSKGQNIFFEGESLPMTYLMPGEEQKLNYEVLVECPNCNVIFDIEGHVSENEIEPEDRQKIAIEKPIRDTNFSPNL